MDASRRQPWVAVIVFVGVAYAVIGVGSAALDDAVWAGGWRPWRVAAWAASLAVAATHVGYELYRLGSAPGRTARHAAGAVALGAFGIALGANVHWLRTHTPGQPAPQLFAHVPPARADARRCSTNRDLTTCSRPPSRPCRGLA